VQVAAVLSGEDIRDVRKRWSPGVVDLVVPRGTNADQIRARYRKLSAWADMDSLTT
jgi:hypothetical protein